eukprot:COSAG05_NODE_538_length_8854_cov_306.308738_4_plen_70_part_00
MPTPTAISLAALACARASNGRAAVATPESSYAAATSPPQCSKKMPNPPRTHTCVARGFVMRAAIGNGDD